MNSKTRSIALIVIIAVIIGLVYWPALRWMVNSWLSSDYYSHGFLVPIVSVFFIWMKRRQFNTREPSPVTGTILLMAGAVVCILGYIWEIRFMGALSLVGVLAGLVFFIWGNRLARNLAFPLVFLLFAIPFQFIQDLASHLQYLSVHWASWIVKTAGLPIQTSGTEIYLGNTVFTVGIVCSGINTLVALMALAAVYAYILKGVFYKRTFLFILAFPVAIGANILRISSIITVAHFYDVETATGWYHDLSSPLFFFIAFGVLVLIGRIMKSRINYAVFS